MGGAHSPSHDHLHVPGATVVHDLAPEAKVAGVIGFVVVVALTPRHAVGVVAVEVAIAVGVVAAARLRLGLVLSRLLVIVPFAGFALLVPFVAGGEQVEVLGLSLSVEGLWGAWNILSKAVLGATASIVLSATTPMPELLRGLSTLRLPATLVAVIAFLFRYLDLTIDQLRRMRTAMTSRGHDPRWLWQAAPIASSAGVLFVRSYERGERVHAAMRARGYEGTMPDLGAPSATARDWRLASVPAGLAGVALLASMVTG